MDLLLQVAFFFFFKLAVRCLVLHDFEGFLQKFRVNICWFGQYVCQSFLETVP